MWIRNQSRKFLGKVSAFSAIENYIYGHTVNREQSELGAYDSKARAMEVLDEIQMVIRLPETKVYQMPEK